MLAHQFLACLVHRRPVELLRDVECARPQQRRRRRLVQDQIAIITPPCTEPSMERPIFLTSCTHRDIFRQQCVERALYRLQAMGRRRSRVHYLSARMNSGIRPSSEGPPRRFPGQPLPRGLELTLNSSWPVLVLRAGKAGAVVFERQDDIAGSRGLRKVRDAPR